MRIYCVRWVEFKEDETGVVYTVWKPDKQGAERLAREVRHVSNASVQAVEVPTKRKELVDWLNSWVKGD